MKRLFAFFLVIAASVALAADVGPVSVVKITGGDEAYQAGVTANDALKVAVTGDVPGGGPGTFKVSGVVPDLTTSTPLGSSGDFTPSFVSTEGYSGMTVVVNGTTSAATGTLYLEFSTDGILADRSISIPVADLTSVNPRTLGNIAEFFRVRYVNDATAQTTFRLQTLFHTSKVELTSRLDQSLDGTEDVQNTRTAIVAKGTDDIWRNIKATNSGDMGVAIFDPETGVPALVTPAGALKISEISHLAGDVFGRGPLASNKWRTFTANGGTISEGNGELTLDTNASVDADAQIDSIQKARFYPGHFNTGHLAFQLSDVWASSDTIAEFGAFDATNTSTGDGLFIRFTNKEWNIVTRKNGVDNVVNESSFSNFIPVKNTNTVVYEIGYNAGTARFYQGTRVFHVETAAAGPYVSTPHLRVGARLYNQNGSNEDHAVRFRALGIYRVGRPFAVPEKTFITNAGLTTIKDQPGTLHRMIITRSGGGASTETVTLYDATTATNIISVIPMSSNDSRDYEFMTTFNDGLSVNLSSSQFDVTLVWD